jgi:hypothetical protein
MYGISGRMYHIYGHVQCIYTFLVNPTHITPIPHPTPIPKPMYLYSLSKKGMIPTCNIKPYQQHPDTYIVVIL